MNDWSAIPVDDNAASKIKKEDWPSITVTRPLRTTRSWINSPRRTLGEFEELKKRGVPPTGTETWGGPVATATGLLFIAATADEKIRAFDQDTGKTLWEVDLPASGIAAPSMYPVDGKERQ
ncbi:MAG: PQQ-binding-like beta-propeller repeat protein [Candidatus Latescibacteria bacterium]|nr:PQQ-binding-like beta-propeller repeat protein [Candidatus Latescibacterota bacterium]